MTDTLSVVICAYTEARWSDLSAAVASVQSQEPPAHEIIVVTDHNDSLCIRARDAFPGVRVMPNAEAQGLSGARNTGISASTGTIVAFLDDDATAHEGWIRELLAPYADPRVLGVGGRVLPRWDDARPAWLPAEFDWVVGCTYTGHRDVAGPVRNVIGANMSVRHAVFVDVGGFRHSLGRTASLPAGCEETELFIRATQQFPDGIVWYAPDAAVSHRVPARATPEYFRARCFAEGVSKTQISRLVGSRDGLASERAYTTRALPRAVLRELGQAARTRDRAGVTRAATVVRGVATTAAGYGAARVPGANRWLPSRNAPARPAPRADSGDGFEPALVTQIDVTDGPRPLPAVDPVTGRSYGPPSSSYGSSARPIGVLELTLGPDGLSADEFSCEIEKALGVAPVAAATLPAPPVAHSNGNGNGNRATASVAIVRERPAAAIVVASRDRAKSLARCLESIRRSDHRAAEIVVVDNASSGRDTAELVRSLSAVDSRVQYVSEPRPGLARAHNCGLEHVTAPIVAFTDDDVVVDPAWLGSLVDGFGRQSNVGCVTGMIFPLELETPAQDWLEHYAGFNKGFEPKVFDLLGTGRATDPLFPYTAGTLGSGANMAFRVDVLRSMRGFDPALGAGTEAKGGDDLAAFFDVIAAGHAIAYEPGAIVYHEHHRTFEVLHRQTFGYGAGLTAYLTKTIVDRPSRVFDMLARAPRAVHHALSPDSAKNERLPSTTPATLVRRERLGMIVGPALYALSRWDTRLDARPGPVNGQSSSDGSVDVPIDVPTDVIVLDETAPDIDLVAMELREASGAT